MFKNALILKLAAPVSFDALTAGAERAQFAPCGPTQPMSAGFVPPREKSGAMVEAIGGHWIMKCLIETKPVPGSEINKRAQAMADRLEQETGRKPGRKQMRELKEQALQELLPAAFPKQSAVLVWIDPERQFVVMDTASVGKSDQVSMLLAQRVEGIMLKLLQTTDNPCAIAHGWLLDGSTDAEEFSLGMDAELIASDESKAAVKYKAHYLDTDEIKEHARSGYGVKRLGLCWKGRVSFVLDPELMVLRRIEFDDVVFEGHKDADAFDADAAILTGELGPLLDDLVAVLGGERQEEAGQPSAPAAPAAPAAHVSGDDGPDPLLGQARVIVLQHNKASISLMQRHLMIGYNRSARLLEALEAEGTVSPMASNGVRAILKGGAA